MKYFDIDEQTECHSFDELVQRAGYNKTLNFTEKFMVLEEQCRAIGLQPTFICEPDGSTIRILPASKKFMKREGRHKRRLSKRALGYMAFCDNADNITTIN